MSKSYDDMLDLPHHTSARHPCMPLIDRAAQFAPFQALAGYSEAVQETARLTQEKVELTEEEKTLLDQKLRQLMSNGQEAVFTYFRPDVKKNGGAYATAVGAICKIDSLGHTVMLSDRTVIPIESILKIEQG